MAEIRDDETTRERTDPLGLGGVPEADAPSRDPRPRPLALLGEFLRMSRNTAILLAAFVLVGALYLLVKDEPVVNIGTGTPAPTAPEGPSEPADPSVSGTDDTTATTDPTPTTDPDSTGTTESTVPTPGDDPSTTPERGRPSPQGGQATEGSGVTSPSEPAEAPQAEMSGGPAADGAAGAGAGGTSGGGQPAE